GMGANFAFRTAAIRELGGFDPALGAGMPSRGGEDLLFISRLLFSGRVLVVDPSVFVYHTHRRTMPELKRQLHGYGVGYTAMLCALVVDDWRHMVGFATYVSHAIKLAQRRSADRRGHSYPDELNGVESRGL